MKTLQKVRHKVNKKTYELLEFVTGASCADWENPHVSAVVKDIKGDLFVFPIGNLKVLKSKGENVKN